MSQVSTADTLYALAYQAYERGNYAEAVHFFRVLTSFDTDSSKYWFGLGACYHMLRNYEQAISAYALAALADQKNPEIPMHAAECFLALNRYSEGIKALEAAELQAADREEYSQLRIELALLRKKWNNCSLKTSDNK